MPTLTLTLAVCVLVWFEVVLTGLHCCLLSSADAHIKPGVSEEKTPGLNLSTSKVAGRNFTVLEGGTTILPCDIAGYVEYPRVWRKCRHVLSAGDRLLTSGKVTAQLRLLADNQLELAELTVGDAGSYTCSVSTQPPLQVTHRVIVLYKPKLQVRPGNGVSLVVMRGHKATLECLVDSNPTAQALWTKTSGRRNMSAVQVSGGTLTLQHVSLQHSGVYRCSAENRLGKTSTYISVRVHYAPDVSLEKTVIHAEIGRSVLLKCYVFAQPSAGVVWSRGVNHVTANDTCCHHVQAAADTGLGTRHVITLPHVTPSDFGTYTCTASNQHGRQSASVVVTGVPHAPEFSGAGGRGSDGLLTASWQLRWSVRSPADVEQYNLLFGTPNDDEEITWSEITVPASRTSTNGRQTQFNSSVIMPKLRNNVTYRLRLQAKNQFGWSSVSRLFSFTTTSITAHPSPGEKYAEKKWRTIKSFDRSISASAPRQTQALQCVMSVFLQLIAIKYAFS